MSLSPCPLKSVLPLGALALASCMATAPAPSTGPAVGAAEQQCRNLATAALPLTTLTTTWNADRAVSSGAPPLPLPAHCVVDATMNPRTGVDGRRYAIGFRMRLPDTWNGRLLFVGGGGNDGSVGTAVGYNVGPLGAMVPAMAQGYAVVSTDGGHTGALASEFGTDPIARVDHAYNAYDKTAVAAKALIAARYDRGPDHAYFMGCSGGGRQGMMFTQRFPTYFDGVIVHAPAMRVSSGATIAAMWNNRRFTEVAPVENGAPILSKAYTNADLGLVSQAILKQCDALDGVADGMVNNLKACRFDAKVLQCSGEKIATCLAPAQVSALQSVLTGPRNSAGMQLYAGQVADPGIDQPGWRQWTLGSSTTAVPDSRYNFLMVDALRWEFITPPDPKVDALAFNYDADPPRMAAESWLYDAYADDVLAPFKARGGKLMMIHGLADPIFSAWDSIDYYERLAAHHGGIAATQAFARLYTVPGENHCGGGRATDQFDALGAMADWVEHGRAPDRIAAGALKTNPHFPNRTRPLCPYPQFARYRGTGSIEEAASFVCSE